MKKTKKYPSVNDMVRGTMPVRKANKLIDDITALKTKENIELLNVLVTLILECSDNTLSGVRVPDKTVVAKARRVAKRYGAVF